MKKILLVTGLMSLSVSVFAHSGHTPFEFFSIIEAVKHHFSSLYHIVAMLVLSVAFIVSAIIIAQRKQILSVTLSVLGFIGSVLGIGLLLS